MKKSLVVLSALFALQHMACKSEDQASPPHSSPIERPRPTSSSRMECVTGEDPYSCLRTACKNADARFDEEQKTCACTEPGTIFYATYGGACIGSGSTKPNLSDFLFDSDSHYYVTDFSKALTAEQKDALLSTRSIPVFSGKMHLMLFSGAEQFKALSDGFDEALINLGFPTTELNWRLPNWGFAYSNLVARAANQFFILPTPKKIELKTPLATQRINKSLEIIRRPLSGSSVTSFSELGCAEICLEKTEIMNGHDARVYRIRVFSGGNPIHDSINVFNKETLEVETMLVLLNGEPSHYFESRGSGSYTLYSNDGTEMKVIGEPVSDRPRVDASSRNESQVPVAIFEGFYSSKVDEVAVYGPHLDSSYYGWFEKSDERPFLYGKALTLLGEEDFTAPEHSGNVARISSGEFTKPLLPLSLTALTSGDFKKVVERLSPVHSKLAASMSALFTYTPDVCRKSKVAEAVLSTEESVLWSIAAGNEGTEIKIPEIPFCPQSLQGKNVLVVAASNGRDRISSASSYGEAYADIAVSGCARENEVCDLGATSYAAPRLARVAADLIESYPQFSIDQIRMAILATTKVPRDWSYEDRRFSAYARTTNRFLKVKSGGTLDALAARNFLSEISQSRTIDPKNLDLRKANQPQIDEIKRSLIKAREHQFTNVSPSGISRLIDDHISFILKNY